MTFDRDEYGAYGVMLFGRDAAVYAQIGPGATGWSLGVGVCWAALGHLHWIGIGWGWDAEVPLRPWAFVLRDTGSMVTAVFGFMLEVR